MAWNGERIVEHNVPEHPTTPERLHGFFAIELGWQEYQTERAQMLTFVPPVDGPVDGIGYWQTNTHDGKNEWFTDTQAAHTAKYSRYTSGLRLAARMALVERPLILPTDEDVARIYEEGGDVLSDHTYIRPRIHAHRLEFRFVDPFLLSVRVAGPLNH